MWRLCFGLAAVVVLSCLAGGPAPREQQSADLVLRNGKIVTLEARFPVVQALAARGDRIVAAGSNQQLARWIGPKTRVIDLQGRLAIPGFIESHGHFVALGQSKMMLNLKTARSWDDIVRQVEAAAKTTPEGRWILGHGWHQEKWQPKPEPNLSGYPFHTRLSQAAPKHPVLLTHASGHMVLANAEAMRLAGVDRTTPNPVGGEILKDAEGNPIGVFRETALGLIHRAHARSQKQRTAAEERQELLRAIELATDECLANGVTSFQDAGAPFGVIDVFKDLARQGKLRVRLWVMVRASNAQLEQLLGKYFLVGFGGHFLTVRAIKEMIDGALGAHGAWLLEPYDDLPGQTGLNIASLPSLRRTAELAARHNYQLCVHAIGDRANRETLNLFEETFRKHPTKESRRWRIEHAQHLHPDDIGRFAKLGVIASMQGVHATSDAPYVLKRLGLRRASESAYVWQSLLQSGAVIANGTDVPVEALSPIECFYASVTRKLPNGTVFFPKQKMTRDQALRSYTTAAAYAAFEDDIKGTLAPGKLADIVVLSRDILTVPDEQILATRVVYTIVGGRVCYENAGNQRSANTSN
jgi:predicted amidohydrolase YtcJ